MRADFALRSLRLLNFRTLPLHFFIHLPSIPVCLDPPFYNHLPPFSSLCFCCSPVLNDLCRREEMRIKEELKPVPMSVVHTDSFRTMNTSGLTSFFFLSTGSFHSFASVPLFFPCRIPALPHSFFLLTLSFAPVE